LLSFVSLFQFDESCSSWVCIHRSSDVCEAHRPLVIIYDYRCLHEKWKRTRTKRFVNGSDIRPIPSVLKTTLSTTSSLQWTLSPECIQLYIIRNYPNSPSSLSGINLRGDECNHHSVINLRGDECNHHNVINLRGDDCNHHNGTCHSLIIT
jgi:hypothetical protein